CAGRKDRRVHSRRTRRHSAGSDYPARLFGRVTTDDAGSGPERIEAARQTGPWSPRPFPKPASTEERADRVSVSLTSNRITKSRDRAQARTAAAGVSGPVMSRVPSAQ